jgi:hypothetical protein
MNVMPSNTIIKTDVLDRGGMDTMLESIFQIVENNYVRKTAYDLQIAALEARIENIENINSILDTYAFDIDDSTGDLTLLVPDDAYNRLSEEMYIDSEGVLYLETPVDTLTTDEAAIAEYSFEIVNKDLILTI